MDQNQKFEIAKTFTQSHLQPGNTYDGILVARAYNKTAKPSETIDWHEFSAALVYLHHYNRVKIVGHNADGMIQYQIA
jgi:hypothetical protein